MTVVESRAHVWPEGHPELLPLLPLFATIWADGILSDAELSVLGRRLRSLDALDGLDLGPLDPWLDPNNPPPVAELSALQRRVREESVGGETGATSSLANLGIAIWQGAGGEGVWESSEAVAELRDLEESLDILGGEAARRLLGVLPDSPKERRATVDAAGLRDYLGRDRPALRERVLEILGRDQFVFEPGLPHDEYRERVLVALEVLAGEGLGRLAYGKEYGGEDDATGSIAVFETLAFGDLSVLVKFGVQFGLFGGSVHQLGTARHHEKYLPRIGTLELPGCYAMTETGHGSNVRDLETTATYDHEARQLVVHTPSEEAGKDWIGNAALHGQLATVFARLIVDDEDHGVHAVLVPVRSKAGKLARGVRMEDRGLKLGLNGVDNGRLWFDQVRVPVDNLLDRFASIDDDGRYHSPIASSGRRFFTMLGTLVAGRVSIAAASVSAAKSGLTIAVRYAARRRQFGPDGAEETPILNYLALQRELAPLLATTFGLHFATRALVERFGAAASGDDPELEAQAAGLKAYASDHCVSTLQACREACGGQGYLAANRFAALRADTDIFTTFEGANLVLYQLAAKGLLSRFREEMGELNLRKAIKYLGERAETSLTELNPLVTRRTEEAHLLDPGFHLAALTYREERHLRSVALRMRARLRDGTESFAAVNEVQDHLIALSKAHVERLIYERFLEGCAAAPAPGLSEVLHTLAALYGLSRIEADRGWYLEAGYLEPVKSRAIRAQVNVLCREVAASAPELVSAFGIPPHLLPAIAH